jgi:hypothetical protein
MCFQFLSCQKIDFVITKRAQLTDEVNCNSLWGINFNYLNKEVHAINTARPTPYINEIYKYIQNIA